MARLPVVNQDSGSWGGLLNDFLTVSHDTDGTIKDIGVVATKYVKPAGGIPASDLSSSVQATLTSVNNGTFVPQSSTLTADPAAPLVVQNRNYAYSAANHDIMQFMIQGTVTAWLNEWGGYRGRPPAGNKEDAIVRGKQPAGLSPTGDGSAIEFEKYNQDGYTVWGRRWRDGALIRNNIAMNDVLVLGLNDSVPADTPAGTVILRRSV